MKKSNAFFTGFFLIVFVLKSIAQNATADFITPFERDSTHTATHTEGVAFYKKLAQRFPQKMSVSTFGVSDCGETLHVAVVGLNKTFTLESARKAGKLVLFINNAIHPGEPEGVDASMLFVRDLVLNPKNEAFLKHIVVVVMPFYNVDGVLNRNSTTRAAATGQSRSAPWSRCPRRRSCCRRSCATSTSSRSAPTT